MTKSPNPAPRAARAILRNRARGKNETETEMITAPDDAADHREDRIIGGKIEIGIEIEEMRGVVGGIGIGGMRGQERRDLGRRGLGKTDLGTTSHETAGEEEEEGSNGKRSAPTIPQKHQEERSASREATANARAHPVEIETTPQAKNPALATG